MEEEGHRKWSEETRLRTRRLEGCREVGVRAVVRRGNRATFCEALRDHQVKGDLPILEQNRLSLGGRGITDQCVN